ncbi:MAG: glycosyltransferase [Prochlorococcus marinus CUG1439]|uniref:glycosyltransferase n=1 Tax=Prochlorococcus sp. MIT 1314 TaxID=3096220 RepID=UPI001AFD5917|nr:glycosyltransferase [Prochlorococcus sp. MIT 1314]MCR8538762.1 glycosyltransferase [Prochlorococcus marinus CUG1439]
MIRKTWYFTYHHNPKENWSLPKGFAKELENQNINLISKEVSNPNNIELPSEEEIEKKQIQVVLIFYAGYNEKLNNNLINFKKDFPKVILINELGDEPQTRKLNYIRAAFSDISLTPDYECYKYWKEKNFNCYWFTHWADSSLFYLKNQGKRKYFIGTSMGNRKYSFILKLFLGKFFINRKLKDNENTEFYNNTNISFQYARWSEITRRIFESGACGCCILTNKIPKEKMLEKIFTHNESIIFYTNIFSLIKQLFLILKDKKKIKRIAENSYHIIQNKHTVEKRVQRLIEIVDNYQP